MIDNIDVQSPELLPKHFCILPFIHACVWTDGRSLPCCSNHDYSFGNIKKTNWKNVYSNENIQLINFRKQMLTGPTLPESCLTSCGIPEKSGLTTLRMYSNKRFFHLMNNINESYNNIHYYDIRLSSLCNLKCRPCDATSSSRIAEEKNFQNIVNKPFDSLTDVIDFFKSGINTVEEIYFCGGEPLLMAEHYQILDLLIENNKADTITLKYNTNCTVLGFKNNNVVSDYWSKFKNVRVDASVDAIGDSLSIIRHGSVWQEVLSNLKFIKKHANHVILSITPIVYNLNVLRIKELHLALIAESVITVNDIYFGILKGPGHYCITSMPKRYKQIVTDNWKEYKEHIKSLNGDERLLNNIQSVIEYMNSNDTFSENRMIELKQEIDKLDKIRGEDTISVIPEVKILLESV